MIDFTGEALFGSFFDIPKWHRRSQTANTVVFECVSACKVCSTLKNLFGKTGGNWSTTSRKFLKIHFVLIRLVYDEYANNLHKFFENETPILWTFDPNIVFSRTDRFIERLNTIQVFSDEAFSSVPWLKSRVITLSDILRYRKRIHEIRANRNGRL